MDNILLLVLMFFEILGVVASIVGFCLYVRAYFKKQLKEFLTPTAFFLLSAWFLVSILGDLMTTGTGGALWIGIGLFSAVYCFFCGLHKRKELKKLS
jgi:hypothetical protein